MSVLDAGDLRRAQTRIAHEIVERNHGAGDVVLVGSATPGAWPSPAASPTPSPSSRTSTSRSAPSTSPSTATTSGCAPVHPLGPTEVPVDITGRVVVLVDDVLYTGRTVRAAMDALTELGRPRAIQLAVLVDRGHRELPIRADFVGKNLPTRVGEDVRVRLAEVDDGEDASSSWGRPEAEEGRWWREAPAVDRRSRRRGPRPRLLDLSEQFVDGEPARHPQGPGAPGQGGGLALLRGLHPHPALASRPRPSASRADTMTFSVSQSSVKKGESLLDTVQTIEAMGIDAIVVRHPRPARRTASRSGSTRR